MQCPSCGSRDIDFHEAGGHSACVKCGTVVEENVIVSSIEFQESGDRSSVIGQFVSATSSKPFNSAVSARGRYGNNQDSRDATLANARRIITQVASSLRLPTLYVDRAYRLYQLALQRNFIMGRRVLHVVATCLYTICRQEKSPHLLIDFSDALQINVYILGKSFLQFSRSLNLKLPIVDPSLYIHRFAARLDLGDKMGGVITTALRIVTRLKKDWISTGRRPDGVCAVAILIASRCHGFHKTQVEISKLFRISTKTLLDRIDDFRATPSAQLTVEQFHLHDFDAEYDPPAFIRGSSSASKDNASPSIGSDEDSEESESEAKEGVSTVDGVKVRKVIIRGVEVNVPLPQGKKKRRLTENRIQKSLARKALYDNIYADISGAATEESAEALRKEIELVAKSGVEVGGWGSSKPHLLVTTGTTWDIDIGGAAIMASTAAALAAAAAGGVESSPAVLPSASTSSSSSSTAVSSRLPSRIYKDGEEYPEEEVYVEPEKKVKTVMEAAPGVPETVLDEGELAAAQEEVMSVNVNGCLLDEEESRKRSAIWEQNFRPFMDERARRRKVRDEGELMRGTGKGRKKYSKRDAPRESASQAVFDGVNTKRASKKINYDALQGAFGGDGSFKLPTQVVVNPALNIYSASSSRNVKPVIDSKSASTTYPFAPFGSSSSMRLSLQGHDKKPSSGIGSTASRKTFLMSESDPPPTSSALVAKSEAVPSSLTDKKIDLGSKPVVVPKEAQQEANNAIDEDDMLMYDDGGDNDDDYDDDEEY